MSVALGELETEFEGEFEQEFESELEGEFEPEFEAEFEQEGEFELEHESEFEGEGLVNPVNRVYVDAMMENLGRAAMEAETEDEAAEHFLPLIPLVASKLLPLAAKAVPKLAGKVLPRVARTIARSTPRLTRNVTQMARTLHRNPRTRPLVRAIPSVARRTVASIAKRAATGRPVTPRHAAQILTHERRRVFGQPQLVRSVLHRSRQMDHRFRRLGLPISYRRFGHGYPRVGYSGVAGAAPRPLRRTGWGASGASPRGGASVCANCGWPLPQAARPTACCCCC